MEKQSSHLGPYYSRTVSSVVTTALEKVVVSELVEQKFAAGVKESLL